MGIRDYFSKTSVSLVEWPDKAEGMLPEPDIRIYFTYKADTRDIVIESELVEQSELDAVKAGL